MSVRIGVMAVVGVVMLALFGGVIFGMVMLISGPAEVDPDQAHRDIFQIDENPFLKAEPSFMGLPVGSRTVFMIDSSAAMRDYLGPIKRAAVRGVETLRGDQRVQIAFWNEGGPIVYPQEPTPAGEIDEEAMVERLEGVYASGGLSPRPAFLKAMEGEPDRIILVARVLPEELALKSIRQQVREGRVHFTVVLIDSPADPLLKEIAEDSGGTVIELPGGRVQRWYEAYLDGVERGS